MKCRVLTLLVSFSEVMLMRGFSSHRMKRNYLRNVMKYSSWHIHYIVFCFSDFISNLFPENIEKLTRGRPTTASVKIKVSYANICTCIHFHQCKFYLTVCQKEVYWTHRYDFYITRPQGFKTFLCSTQLSMKF